MLFCRARRLPHGSSTALGSGAGRVKTAQPQLSRCGASGGFARTRFGDELFAKKTWAPPSLDGEPCGPLGGHPVSPSRPHDSYLVDPASSHMLVSKTKPCMSKYKRFYTVKLRMAH